MASLTLPLSMTKSAPVASRENRPRSVVFPSLLHQSGKTPNVQPATMHVSSCQPQSPLTIEIDDALVGPGRCPQFSPLTSAREMRAECDPSIDISSTSSSWSINIFIANRNLLFAIKIFIDRNTNRSILEEV